MKPGERQIVQAIDAAMRARGWPRVELCGLLPAYANDTIVTPYFHCSGVPLRSFGDFAVEGIIGLIHQGFERLWIRDPNRTPREQGFGFFLNTVNWAELRDKMYVNPNGDLQLEVEAFCSATASILNTMPRDEPD